MQKKSMIWKSMMVLCVVGILLNSSVASAVENVEGKTNTEVTYRNVTYYNATIKIISYIYHVNSYSENEIILRSWKQPFLLGIFYISDENGVQVCNVAGGWMNSIVTITGFEGFFKDWIFEKWGLYIVVWGKCDKVDIQWFR